MGNEIDTTALTVTVAGFASFGVVQATRVMVDWVRELIEPESPYTVRWIVTAISLMNVALWALSFTQGETMVAGGVSLGSIAAWTLAVVYITVVVSWTVNSYHVKEQLNRFK